MTRSSLIGCLIEDNLFQYLKYFCQGNGGYIHDGFEDKWVYSGNKNFNTVFYSKYSENVADSKVAAVLDKFIKWNVPLTWFITSSCEPANLHEFLIESGFKIGDALSGMLLDLDDLPKALTSRYQLQIYEVSDQETLFVWANVLASGFGAIGANADAFKSTFTSLGVARHLPWRHYIAILDGIPVSTCTLFNSGAIIGIYWVATLTEFRKKGIASYLLWHILSHARDNGHKYIALQATQLGKGVYESLGFEVICETSTYQWIPR